jgi:hypothetical protein
VTFEYEFGETADEANTLFGADIVWAYAKRALVIAAQGHARGLLKSNKSIEEIQALMDAWKPGSPRAKISSEDRMRAEWAKMSPEDRANLLRELSGGGDQASDAPDRPRRGKSV